MTEVEATQAPFTPEGRPPPDDEDSVLVGRCRDGDLRAWDALYNRYESLVFSIPLAIGLDRDDAADVAQTTFTQLIERLDSLQDPGAVGSWLATIARRESWLLVSRGRKESVRGEVEHGDNPAGRVDVGQVEKIDRLLWVVYGLRCLDERCRTLLMELYFGADDPSYADVAEKLGMPLGSVGPTRARCLERLREILGSR